MTRGRIRCGGILAFGMLVLSAGCATRGQLERGLQEQRDALATERQERVAADQRLAGELRGEIEGVARNVDALRTELAALDSEFGARLTSLEEGLQLAVPVHFAFDRADVSDDAAPVLDRFVEIVRRNYPDAAITVEGFTDPAGSAAYNRRLAQRRADAVRDELVRRGLPETQLRAVGYGAERLVVPGAAGRAYGAELNRRVVFVIETPTQSMLEIPSAAQ
jgi:outer membrane protein OmpA-like peptidoglycan-associated protein